MGLSQRGNRFNGVGQVISIRPSSGTPTTEVEAYQINSRVLPADVIHTNNAIFKPGTETALESDAKFFEPVETYGADNTPSYSQLVINEGFTNPLLISQYTDEFPITRPGVMSSRITSKARNLNPSNQTITASLGPRPVSEPQTYRRKGLVQVYLTTSSTPDDEVAYSNNGVNWCSMTITNSYASVEAASSASETTFRTFNNYLVGAGATNEAGAFVLGNAGIKYVAFSSIDAEGSTTYNTNGIYRSEVKPFLRDTSGTQYYIKTNVTFETASVASSATLNGTLTGSWNSETYEQGYNEFEDGDDPVYTATPDTDRYVVSLKVNGVAQSISDHSTAEQYTFNNVSGSNSIEAEFGFRLNAQVTSGSANKIRIGSTTITDSDGVTAFYFTEGSQVFVEFLDASDNPVTTTSLVVNGVTETNAQDFTFDGFKTNQTIVIT